MATVVNEPLSRHALAFVLAGGRGSRLLELTDRRAKPAVYFGGKSRIIDFALSNAVNSGIRRIAVSTQYKAHSLIRHLQMGWNFFRPERNESFDILPASQRISETNWYLGTADAVYQNIDIIEPHRARFIVLLAGDHIYKMDYSEVLQDHIDNQADCTIGCIPVELREGINFGVMEIDKSQRVVKFLEKPPNPDPMPDDPNRCLASMGIYVFNANFLFDQLCRDATVTESNHDFGRDIIPTIIDTHRVRAFPFRDRNSGNSRYWRDVGTLDAYYAANMDLVAVEPQLNLYDEAWEIRTYHPPLPPPKFVFAQFGGSSPRAGMALDSMVSPGTIISGGRVERSILSPNVRVNSWACVEDSILFEGVNVGRHAKIRRAIIDKGVVVPEGAEVGYNLELDRARGFTVTESGVVVIGKLQGFVDVHERSGAMDLSIG